MNNSFGISPSHIFSISGIYVVTLKVIDEAGNEGSDTMTVEVKTLDSKDDNGLFILYSLIVAGMIFVLIIAGILLIARRRGSRSGLPEE